MKVYIRQAHEFYQAATSAKANTAPLIYYYAFLNLAKALCELHSPGFHKHTASYNHGLSWKPNSKYIVNLRTEKVSLSTRGVWHILWESIVGMPLHAPNPAKILLKDLFLSCPEISVEAEMTLGNEKHLVPLVKPDILYDAASDEAWIYFNVDRAELKRLGLSASALLALVQTTNASFKEVKAPEADLRAFEYSAGLKVGARRGAFDVVHDEIRCMYIFSSLEDRNQFGYDVPIHKGLPVKMPQIIVLYTIMFWLASLVRYDPHSVVRLEDSIYWTLIDGFMGQSRLWLLEQFEWALYRTETGLWTAR